MNRAFLAGVIVLALGGLLSFAQVIPQPGPPTPIGCAYNSSAPTLTNGQAVWVQCDVNGQLKVSSLSSLIACDSYVYKHITSATDTLAVQGVTAQTIYICGFHARAAGTATWFLENTASTNANCSSSNTQISILNSEVANSGIVDRSAFYSGLKTTAGNGLCINSTGTGGVDVGIYYTQR